MKEIKFAFKQVVPIVFTYIFVGIAFGILMSDAGYSWLWTLLASFFIYAGSMQIVIVTLLSSGAALYTVALMTFFINVRHIFYGVGFVDRFRSMGWRYPYMVLTLTDEVYSILCSAEYPDDIDRKRTDFFISLMSHMTWVISSVAGAVLGRIIPYDMTGIDFSCTAFFVVVCVNQWQRSGSHIPALTGLISAVVFYFLLGPDSFLLPALSVSLIVLVLLRGPVERMDGGLKHV